MAEKPNLKLHKSPTTLTTMKPILLLPVVTLLASCAALTTPVYLTGEAPESEDESTAEPSATAPTTQAPATTRTRTTGIQPALPTRTTQPGQPRQATQPTIRRTGNFVQPDVLTIPKKDELKETATSTETAPPPPSVTIPAGQ